MHEARADVLKKEGKFFRSERFAARIKNLLNFRQAFLELKDAGAKS
jgi:hypothetical protein